MLEKLASDQAHIALYDGTSFTPPPPLKHQQENSHVYLMRRMTFSRSSMMSSAATVHRRTLKASVRTSIKGTSR